MPIIGRIFDDNPVIIEKPADPIVPDEETVEETVEDPEIPEPGEEASPPAVAEESKGNAGKGKSSNKNKGA